MSNIVLGADIGGSHITASLIDVEERKIIEGTMVRKDVNGASSIENIVKEWSSVIRESFNMAALKPGKIGLAMPGPVDYEEGICYIKGQNKFEELYGVNLKELLSESLELESNDIRMINDAAGFLFGESFIGAARGYEKVIGLTLGTGLGSAYYCNGKTMDADLWHSSFKDGKAEDYLNASRLLNTARTVCGISFGDVRQLALYKDCATPVFELFGKDLGEFLVTCLKNFPSDLVVLGGNISKAHKLFMPSLLSTLSSNNIDVPVKIAEIGERAALVGAAALWDATESKEVSKVLAG
jgi:glucokinase